jgi:hypothetical protein
MTVTVSRSIALCFVAALFEGLDMQSMGVAAPKLALLRLNGAGASSSLIDEGSRKVTALRRSGLSPGEKSPHSSTSPNNRMLPHRAPAAWGSRTKCPQRMNA